MPADYWDLHHHPRHLNLRDYLSPWGQDLPHQGLLSAPPGWAVPHQPVHLPRRGSYLPPCGQDLPPAFLCCCSCCPCCPPSLGAVCSAPQAGGVWPDALPVSAPVTRLAGRVGPAASTPGLAKPSGTLRWVRVQGGGTHLGSSLLFFPCCGCSLWSLLLTAGFH